MPFYVIRNSTTRLYLPLLGNTGVADLREAAVFSMRGAAVNAIRRAWRESCVVERIERLPDRIPRRRGNLSRDLRFFTVRTVSKGDS